MMDAHPVTVATGSQPHRKARRLPWLLLCQVMVLLLLVAPFISGTFRDNDQAIILDGSWILARHQAPFWHALFYNFDKQWGVFLALSWLFRLWPHLDPVFSANLLVALLASLAWLSIGFRRARTRNVPLSLLLPVLFSPVLLLYIPYLGTGWFSLALLLLSFYVLNSTRSKIGRTASVLLLAASSACRGDVVLAVPALILSHIPRSSFTSLLRRPLAWWLSAAAVLPVLAGKVIAGASLPDSNPFSLDLRAYLGYLLFGLTPAVLVLLAGTAAWYAALSVKRKRFHLFYGFAAVSSVIPLAFYSPQLYTLRYFFLTIAAVLFLATNRRSVLAYRKAIRGRYRWFPQALILLTFAPWLIGLNVPVLRHPRLTVSNPTRFPTGDGRFPLAAYLGFEWQVRTQDHLSVDHNQNMWLAAKSVSYRACPNGTVPFLITPMSNFIQFAIRLQGKKPLPIDYLAESPCGMAYTDARSILRGYRPDRRDGDLFADNIHFVSSTGNGQVVALINLRGPTTVEARMLEEVRDTLGRYETDLFVRPAGDTSQKWMIPSREGLHYVVFSSGPCQANEPIAHSKTLIQLDWTGHPKSPAVTVARSAPFAGWAHTTLPPYMGL